MSKSVNVMPGHGACSCWSKVILLLQAKGYKVTATQIRLTSFSDDIAVTQRLLSAQTERTVLLGHLYDKGRGRRRDRARCGFSFEIEGCGIGPRRK